MNLIQQVATLGARVTPAEHRIAAYIIDYPELVLKLNVAQLAQAAGASPATVVRFFKRGEFGNFGQFKILLSSQLAGQPHPTTQDVRPHDDYDLVKQTLLENALQSLYKTADTLMKPTVLEVVAQIHKAKRIYLIGIGASYLVAENIVQKWMRAGISMQAYQEANTFLPLLETAGPEDLFWFISNSGETPEVVWTAQAAARRGLKTVSLTRVGDNRLAHQTKWQLHTASPIEATIRSAATNSLLSQFLVIDVMYYVYLSRYYDELSERLTHTHTIIDEYHRAMGWMRTNEGGEGNGPDRDATH